MERIRFAIREREKVWAAEDMRPFLRQFCSKITNIIPQLHNCEKMAWLL